MEWGLVLQDVQQLEKGLSQFLLVFCLVVAAAIISYLTEIGLEGDILSSVIRCFFQLSAVGLVLQAIFSQRGLTGFLIIGGCYVFMVLMAGYTAGSRAKGVPRAKLVAGFSIFCATSVTLVAIILLRIFKPTPRYLVPVMGMMIGSSMKVTGVALKCFREDLRQQQDLVEIALALGATPGAAACNSIRRAIVLAVSPKVDAAKTHGIVSIPGTMMGMMLAGTSPLLAAKTQIATIALTMGVALLSAMLAVYLSWHLFFSLSMALQKELLRDLDPLKPLKGAPAAPLAALLPLLRPTPVLKRTPPPPPLLPVAV